MDDLKSNVLSLAAQVLGGEFEHRNDCATRAATPGACSCKGFDEERLRNQLVLAARGRAFVMPPARRLLLVDVTIGEPQPGASTNELVVGVSAGVEAFHPPLTPAALPEGSPLREVGPVLRPREGRGPVTPDELLRHAAELDRQTTTRMEQRPKRGRGRKTPDELAAEA